jgi:hypothetical protein
MGEDQANADGIMEKYKSGMFLIQMITVASNGVGRA